MKSFTHVVVSPEGLHIRTAGQLARLAEKYSGPVVRLSKGENTARADQMFGLLALGVGQGDCITVSADGPGEEEALEAFRALIQHQL